jgi:hypothetical protein
MEFPEFAPANTQARLCAGHDLRPDRPADSPVAIPADSRTGILLCKLERNRFSGRVAFDAPRAEA